MATTVNGLRLRRVLGKSDWFPPEQFGPDGWMMVHHNRTTTVIVSAADHDGMEYVHASVADMHQMPTYEDLVLLHRAVFGDGYAYQVFAPNAQHVNIHEYALHLWGRADGQPVLPEFGSEGTI